MRRTEPPTTAPAAPDTPEQSTLQGFEIEVLSQPYSDVVVPVPGGCNSSNSGSSNDDPPPDET